MINCLFSGGIKKSIEKLMLNDTVLWKGQEIQEWKALIPGCALGSFFANYTLKECDDYFENKNSVYARYSDDIIVLEDSKEELQKAVEAYTKRDRRYGLVKEE